MGHLSGKENALCKTFDEEMVEDAKQHICQYVNGEYQRFKSSVLWQSEDENGGNVDCDVSCAE